jgi:LPS-assembly protein
MIYYDDVRFLVKGEPVFYVPYFSHPDGTIDQKTGFLTPEFGFGSDYGFNVMVPYYHAFDPSFDATVGLRAFTSAVPQLNIEMRKRYDDAYVRTAGSVTYSDRRDRVDGDTVTRDEEFRGHFELDSLWNINNHWRAGTDIKVTSDEQYLDEYNIDTQDVLTNRIYAEGFDDRNYASAQLLAFQDLRLDVDVDQPNALPYMQAQKIGAPNSFAGGRLQVDASYLNLFRQGNDQDVNRLSSRLSWKRQDILPMGLVSQSQLAVRGDAYYTTDRDVAKVNPTQDENKFDARAIPTASTEIGLPLVKPVPSGQLRIKPKIGLTVRPDVDNDSDIPNEDSIDAQINVTNLFDIDRFPGLDRVEDRSHLNYMVETGYYKNNGDEVTLAIGQSYRLDDVDNPFQNGSGFENQESDFVGQVGVSLDNHRHNVNYRFQLDGRGLDVERHEIYGDTLIEKTRISGIYLYEKGSPGTEFEDSREQIQLAATRPFGEKWSAQAAFLYDLGVDSGLRKSSLAINYDDECYGITGELRRDLLDDAANVNDTTLLVRLRLKNLGEFETTAYDFGGTGESDNLEDDLIE